ncbi:thioredoxin family protein [Lacihabitans sp. CCS-44]|uniref:thioredoxin family protein n=1 Tax=Lacihabitans sp. CCS-44 TaxID=2487331 RepID=UPI0020CBA4EB|nr:thioredoxin family protein [Lacihabitans sp. CCS-44]MCP9757379.1 thioredoxin family protein [Lacihabitans sp. CCS-44]
MKKLVAFLIISIAFSSLASFKTSKPESFGFYKGSFDNVIRESKKQKKPIILDFWAAWCAPCQKLDKETFTDKELGAYLSQNYLVYKVDIDTFDGMEIVDRFSIDVFPTMLVYDPKNGQIGKFKGFYPAGYLQKELEKVQAKYNIYPVHTQDGLAINR